MYSQQSIRATLLSLLQSFETPDEQNAWKNESFSLYPCDCGWPEAELDFIFFWKVYAQQRLAAKSYDVFISLRQECGSMAHGIRALATVPDTLVQNGLKNSYESGELELISKPVASAVGFGLGGWRELGFAIGAAKRLCQWFPSSDQHDYVLQWLSRTLNLGVNRQDQIVTALNGLLKPTLGDCHSILQVPNRIICMLSGGKSSSNGLPGAGPETIQFFFRDWMDLSLWKFIMFKNDEHNQAFWNIFFQEAGVNIGTNIAQELAYFLEVQDFEAGVLARLNRMAYRMRSRFGSALEDDTIRQRIRYRLDQHKD